MSAEDLPAVLRDAIRLASWAAHAGLDPGAVTVKVRWELAAEAPKRIERIEMVLGWPRLPKNRIVAAERAATACPIHATLSRAAQVLHHVVTSEIR